MKEFIEKWKTDSRFKAKIKLGLYTLFVLFVAILAFSNNNGKTVENITDEYQEKDEQTNDTETMISVTEEYDYTISVTINEDVYNFEGSKTKEKETITKIFNETENKYIYINNKYYKDDSGIYILTKEENIFEPINKNYIEIDTINEYLKNSKKENGKHIVYLKDIILGNSSDDYIIITISGNKKNINIDYTMLMKYFDNNTEKYIINIEIE